MKENEMEQLLEKICGEQIEPPAHLVAVIRQAVFEPTRTVDLTIRLKMLHDAPGQHLIGLSPWARWPLQPVVKSTARDAQGSTHGTDLKLIPVRLHPGVLY